MTEVSFFSPIWDNTLLTSESLKSDITAILARKNNLQAGKPSAQFATMERSRLNQARTLALRRQDYTEVEVIDQQLAELPVAASREEDISDRLAKVNERNRKANLEAVRKAELQEAERKRRERKAARAVGTPTPQDPSARLKTIPKLFNSISRLVFFHSVLCVWVFLWSTIYFCHFRISRFSDPEPQSQMPVHLCYFLNKLAMQCGQYPRCHHLRCQGTQVHLTSSRHSKLESLTRLRLTWEISEGPYVWNKRPVSTSRSSWSHLFFAGYY